MRNWGDVLNAADFDACCLQCTNSSFTACARSFDENVSGTHSLIDSIYSPVIKCNYNVSDTRVGNEMDYDKLTLELDTDGSVNADDAVATAADILISCFTNFLNIGDAQDNRVPAVSDEAQDTDVSVEGSEIDKIRELPIDDLELSVRAFNCLKRAEINTIGELMDKTEDELTRVRNLGKKSVDEIKEKLTNFKGLGIGLKDGNAKD